MEAVDDDVDLEGGDKIDDFGVRSGVGDEGHHWEWHEKDEGQSEKRRTGERRRAREKRDQLSPAAKIFSFSCCRL